jgi:serine/threonine protein kinase
MATKQPQGDPVWAEWYSKPPLPGFKFRSSIRARGELRDCEVVERLGKGGQAVAMLVKVAGVDFRHVVFKIFDQPQLPGSRTVRELQLLDGVEHRSISKAGWRLEQQGKVLGVVYDYVEGVTLEQWCRSQQSGTAKAFALRDITIKLLAVLELLERLNIVHRDITPRNIIIRPNGEPCLIDFGLVVRANSYTEIWGTSRYMAPERFNGDPPHWRWDTFGLAASVLECFVEGKFWRSAPYDGQPVEDAALNGLDPVTKDLCKRLLRELEPHPLDRHPTIRDFHESLEMVADRPKVSGEKAISSWVKDLLTHSLGGEGVLAVMDDFTVKTKVPTRLELELLPKIVAGNFKVVFLCGNPGDGKTTFLKMDLLKTLSPSNGEPHYLDAERDTGWTVRHKQREFKVIYDGSEGVGPSSSDDRIRGALRFALDGDSRTAVIAINDGRLVNFLTKFSDEFDFASDIVARIRGSHLPDAEVVLVDLKARAQVAKNQSEGLAIQSLKKFINADDWNVCDSCEARLECPIKENADTLRKDSVQSALSLLLEVSHLRRRRRVTFREVRSMLGRLITAGINCEVVHSERAVGENPSIKANRLVHDILFAGQVDYEPVLREIAQLDPSRLPLVDLVRTAIANRDIKMFDPDSDAVRRSLARKLSLGLLDDVVYGAVDQMQVIAYKHLGEFMDMLENPTEQAKSRILLGMSRIVAAPGFSARGLAIRAVRTKSDWALLKVIESDRFRLARIPIQSNYVETFPDRLELEFMGDGQSEAVHRLVLTLDLAEVILRAADGQIFDDLVSDSAVEEILGFALVVATSNTEEVHIASPSGLLTRAVLANDAVELSRA